MCIILNYAKYFLLSVIIFTKGKNLQLTTHIYGTVTGHQVYRCKN